jgi:hypothetical protein
MYIFLDDCRVPEDVTWITIPQRSDWIVVRSYEEFVALLDTLEEAPDYIAFDHDLADAHYMGDFSNPDEKTGYDCAKHFVDVCILNGWAIPEFCVHSFNPIGATNIRTYLENARKHLED